LIIPFGKQLKRLDEDCEFIRCSYVRSGPAKTTRSFQVLNRALVVCYAPKAIPTRWNRQ